MLLRPVLLLCEMGDPFREFPWPVLAVPDDFWSDTPHHAEWPLTLIRPAGFRLILRFTQIQKCAFCRGGIRRGAKLREMASYGVPWLRRTKVSRGNAHQDARSK